VRSLNPKDCALPHAVSEGVYRHASDAGVGRQADQLHIDKRVSMHTLRHGFATHLERKVVDHQPGAESAR